MFSYLNFVMRGEGVLSGRYKRVQEAVVKVVVVRKTSIYKVVNQYFSEQNKGNKIIVR